MGTMPCPRPPCRPVPLSELAKGELRGSSTGGVERRAQESMWVVGCPVVSCGLAAAALRLRTLPREEVVRRTEIPASRLLRERKATAQEDNPIRVSRMKWYLLTSLLVLLTTREAEALREPEICYVLDGILFFYGIILTFLYCRLKIQYRKRSKAGPSPIYEKVEGVYTGLSMREPETYTTLELPKRDVPEQPCSSPTEIYG